MNLNGRVVLVTGGAYRVGRAIALRLARQGCHLAVHYRRSREGAEEVAQQCIDLGGQAATFAADLTRRDEVGSLVPAVLEHFGRLDVLINNASVFEVMPIEGFDLADWDKTLQVNLTAPMMLVDAAREELLRREGRIINLCDISTSRPWPDHVAYMVSKGGLDTLTRVLARALAPKVNVCGIAPGAVEWPPEYDQELRDRLTRKIPLLRGGSAEDIASAVEFLLREGDYLTGLILPVDGGRQIV
jgi:pteridine reductase